MYINLKSDVLNKYEFKDNVVAVRYCINQLPNPAAKPDWVFICGGGNDSNLRYCPNVVIHGKRDAIPTSIKA